MRSLIKLSWGMPFFVLLFTHLNGGGHPNQLSWPPSIEVISPSDSKISIQEKFDSLYTTNGNGSGKRWDGTLEGNGSKLTVSTPKNVKKQSTWDDNGQFTSSPKTFLFLPGTYEGLNLYVGYYTSVIGLGVTQKETTIDVISCYMGNGQIDTPCCPPGTGGGQNQFTGALNTFWRSIENFTTNPNEKGNIWWPTSSKGMTWAASQACPMRKINVNGNLYLFQLYNETFHSGFSSGGFMSDCKIEGIDPTQSALVVGSQQQYFCRNSSFASFNNEKPPVSNGVWNQVFLGCNGAPTSNCGNCPGQTNTPICPNYSNCSGCKPDCKQQPSGSPYTSIARTPRMASKPYIYVKDPKYYLAIPNEQKDLEGPWEYTDENTISIDFENVYIASESDTATIINQQINEGNHIVFSPGIYKKLGGSIHVNKKGTVLLGLGFPILQSSDGDPCIVVEAPNVRVASFLLEAGGKKPPPTTLLRWGSTPTDGENGYLYDCFARTGKFYASPPSNTDTELMVHIISNGVTGDNLWLWRADHEYGPNNTTNLVKDGKNYCQTCIQIDGDNVNMYGLAVEHALKIGASTPSHQCIWNGNNGKCYFFQCEMPYDAPLNYDTNTVGYKLGPSVTTHNAWGVGVYSFFRYHEVSIDAGISSPAPGSGISFSNSLVRYLAGHGGIKAVIKNEETNQTFGTNTQDGIQGVSLDVPGPSYVKDFPSADGGTVPYNRNLP